MSEGDHLASTILRVFADLEPERPSEASNVLTNDPAFSWLGTDGAALFVPGVRGPPWTGQLGDPALTRLAAIDALHRHERLLRIGWVFVTGRRQGTGPRGSHEQICIPLLSVPVRLNGVGLLEQWTPTLAGDAELTPLVKDRAAAMELLARAEFGGGGFEGMDPWSIELIDRMPNLKAWIFDVARAAGLQVERLLPPGHHPAARMHDKSLNALVGAGIYVTRDADRLDDLNALLRWAGTDGIGRTAFRPLYDDTWSGSTAPATGWVRSPLPLTAQQRRAVLRSRRDAIVAVSGPPGNGKSHAAVAMAIDAVARGESVLIATRSVHAAEVLGTLLARHPGPIPIMFGSSEQRETIAAELAAGTDSAEAPSVAECEQTVALSLDRVAHLERILGQALEVEHLAESAGGYDPMVPSLSARFPNLFDGETDLDALPPLLNALSQGRGLRGWWRRYRARSRLGDVGLTHHRDPTEFHTALQAARARRAAAELGTAGGTNLQSRWLELGRADDQAALAIGALLSEQSRALRALGGPSRRTVGALAHALRAGRAARRDMLQKIDGENLLRVLPLWIGTLHDIEDLLPPDPAMFDLAILDEASQIEQPTAAPALLRAKRAVVVGDPRQLRHVSFLSDAAIANCLERHGISHLADRLDLRRNSIFDVAAGATPVTHLDEHFRSVPHLIDFSARRFYEGHINLMTRHPRNEQVDAIDIVRVEGKRDEQGVNQPEIDAVEKLLRSLRYEFASIGVVSPFRAQADALEEMILERFHVDDINQIGLSVGTVHSFQGGEKDAIIASLAICDDDKTGSWTFLQDPHLFNVLITRARRRMIVVTSTVDPPDGLLRAYLDHESRPPGSPGSTKPTHAWTERLATELTAGGLAVRTGYPVGRWTLDLVVGEGDEAVAIECGVHPAGPAAHMERRRALRRAGWQVTEAYPSRWDDDPVRAAVTLTTELRAAAGPSRPAG